jgi:hypothetical protein
MTVKPWPKMLNIFKNIDTVFHYNSVYIRKLAGDGSDREDGGGMVDSIRQLAQWPGGWR